MGLPFTSDAHAGVADGSITVTWRAWSRPMVKVGGRHVVGYRVSPTGIALLREDGAP
jgi:hypothetical protein